MVKTILADAGANSAIIFELTSGVDVFLSRSVSDT